MNNIPTLMLYMRNKKLEYWGNLLFFIIGIFCFSVAIFFYFIEPGIGNTEIIKGNISKFEIIETHGKNHDLWAEIQLSNYPNIEFRLNHITNEIHNLEKESYSKIPVEFFIRSIDTIEFKKENGWIEIFGFKYGKKTLWTTKDSLAALRHNRKVIIILWTFMGMILVYNGIKKMKRYYNK